MSTYIRMSECERAPRSAAPTFDAAARAEREPYQNPPCQRANVPTRPLNRTYTPSFGSRFFFLGRASSSDGSADAGATFSVPRIENEFDSTNFRR